MILPTWHPPFLPLEIQSRHRSTPDLPDLTRLPALNCTKMGGTSRLTKKSLAVRLPRAKFEKGELTSGRQPKLMW